MECPKHPAYKGLKALKRDCLDCQKLYNYVRSTIKTNSQNKWGAKFVSLSTPTHAYATQLLAELSVFMIYGIQKPYFWKSKTAASNHYMTVLKKLSAWRHRDQLIFDLFEQFMFHIYTQYKQEEVSEDVKARQLLSIQKIEEQEEKEENAEEQEIDQSVEVLNIIPETSRKRLMMRRNKYEKEAEPRED